MKSRQAGTVAEETNETVRLVSIKGLEAQRALEILALQRDDSGYPTFIYIPVQGPLRDVGDVKSRGSRKLKRNTQIVQSQLLLEETWSMGCCIAQRK